MAHIHGLSPEEQRKMDIGIANKGFILLLIVTLIEVGLALIGNGHLIEGFTLNPMIMIPVMIIFSLYKAYYIVSVFMHLGSEVGGMAYTIVMPMFLLVWAVIAFLWEGDSARQNRNYVKDARPGVEMNTEDTPETSMKTSDELEVDFSFS